VAVFVDRGLGDGINTPAAHPPRVLVPFMGSRHDRLALELAGRIGRNTGSRVTVLHVVPPKPTDGLPLDARSVVNKTFNDPTQPTPVEFRVVADASPVSVVLRESADFDLVIVGVSEEWGLESHLFGWRPERIARETPASLMIVRKSAEMFGTPEVKAEKQTTAV
jgi:nucleotide-binding universal stress UspA family protein